MQNDISVINWNYVLLWKNKIFVFKKSIQVLCCFIYPVESVATLILIAFHSKEKCTINTFFLVYNVFVFVFEQIHDVPIDTHRNCNLAMFTMPTSVPLDTFQSKRLHDNDINALSIAFVCFSLMAWTCFMLIKIDLVFFLHFVDFLCLWWANLGVELVYAILFWRYWTEPQFR